MTFSFWTSTPISFREAVPAIPSTTYATHGLFYYPAKFIPQVVRYCLENYTQTGETVLDPFAGSGTVGLEAFICQRNAYLLDLNLMLNQIIPLKIYAGKSYLQESRLQEKLLPMFDSPFTFTPAWRTVGDWYPPQMLAVWQRYWGWQKQLPQEDIYTHILTAALLKASKRFSWAEHKTPKLFKSKSKTASLSQLLTQDWQTQLRQTLWQSSHTILRQINSLIQLTHQQNGQVSYQGGVDSSTFLFDAGTTFDALITSPPYLQAQEYIRTSKLDLFWLGYTELEIRALNRLEIPYRQPTRTIHTPTLDQAKAQIHRPDLLQLVDAYFCHTINALENGLNQLRPGGYGCIFIGNPKIDGVLVEIWRIFQEYLTPIGFETVQVYEDRIKSRRLFASRKNKNPDGMKSEYLLVLRKTL